MLKPVFSVQTLLFLSIVYRFYHSRFSERVQPRMYVFDPVQAVFGEKSIMRMILFTLMSLLTLRFRRRRSLELEVIALRHQLSVLKRRRKFRPRFAPSDRLVWSWLYDAHPQALKWIQLVHPRTVIEWHRRGFLFYWRARSAGNHSPWKVKGNYGISSLECTMRTPDGARDASKESCSNLAIASPKLRSANILQGIR